MIDSSTPEWKNALSLVRSAFSAPENLQKRLEAERFLANCAEPRISRLAPLLSQTATVQDIQAAIVPLERVDRRTRITDADMGITTEDRAECAGVSGGTICVVTDNLRSAFNVGGIFRTCDFFGIQKLVLCGYTATPENEQVKRAALGAEESVLWEHRDDIRTAVEELKKQGYKIYALETGSKAMKLDKSFTPQFPCVILLGNERFGLDPDVVAAADGIIEIPALGKKNSLNVVSAFAVAAAFFRA